MPSSRTLSTALAAGGALLAVGAALVGAAPASAASVDADQPITKVATYVAGHPGRTDPQLGDQLTTAIDWCAPAGAKPGDTFTLSLDPKLVNLPSRFDLDDPSGAPVATGAIAGNAPGVITFTLLKYIDSHDDTCGTADVTADFKPGSVKLGQPNPFTDTTGDGRAFTTEITPSGNVQGDLSYPAKYAAWTAADQGRKTAKDFLAWFVTTPQGDFATATTTDTVPTGQVWRWDCSTIKLEDGTIDPATGDFTSSAIITPAVGVTTLPNFTCTPTTISVNWGPQVVGHIFRVSAETSIPAPTGAGAAQRFSNTADVSTTTAAGVRTARSVSSSMIQASAYGQGVGVASTPAVTPTPTSTPTPTQTAPQTPPAAAPAPAATAAPVAATTSGPGTGELAYTGSEPGPAVWIGGAMVLLGGIVAGMSKLRARRNAR